MIRSRSLGTIGPGNSSPRPWSAKFSNLWDTTSSLYPLITLRNSWAWNPGIFTWAVEMWETTGKDALEASLATGKTVDLGETGMDAIEEWWYPLYMKEKCPGLHDWTALNDCAEAFSTPETNPKGRYLGGPVTWSGYDDERTEIFGFGTMK